MFEYRFYPRLFPHMYEVMTFVPGRDKYPVDKNQLSKWMKKIWIKKQVSHSENNSVTNKDEIFSDGVPGDKKWMPEEAGYLPYQRTTDRQTLAAKELVTSEIPPVRLVTEEQYAKIVENCNRAKMEWKAALNKLDWVVEPDEIDYVIYSLIAAEKHYTSLLKEAKRAYRELTAQDDASCANE